MANIKTMTTVQRLFQQGKTREQLAKQFKVSTSTIDDWRRKVTRGKVADTTHDRVVDKAATRKVRTAIRQVRRMKSETALTTLHQENIRLAAVVGKLFLALTDKGNDTVSKVVL